MPSDRRAFLSGGGDGEGPPDDPDVLDWHQASEELLMAVPKHMDPDLADYRGEWIVGRGIDLREVA